MGWNDGYTAMERSVIALYNTGMLTKDVLEYVMEPYKATDCDSGGSCELCSKDGLGVEEIICKVMEPEKYAFVSEHPVWYEGEGPGSEFFDRWKSNKAGYDLFWSIWNGHWGIH